MGRGTGGRERDAANAANAGGGGALGRSARARRRKRARSRPQRAAGAMLIQAESAGGDDGGGAVPVCTLDGDGTTLGQTGRLALRSTLRISCGHALFKAPRVPREEWWAYGGRWANGMVGSGFGLGLGFPHRRSAHPRSYTRVLHPRATVPPSSPCQGLRVSAGPTPEHCCQHPGQQVLQVAGYPGD